MSAPTLRRAEPGDLDALVALLAQLNPDDPPPARDRLAAILADIVASPHFDVLVATRADAVVATCYLAVMPNLTRGGGLGRELVRFALAEAWRRGCYKTLLQTGSRDPRVHRFYLACGFSADEKTGFVARPARA